MNIALGEFEGLSLNHLEKPANRRILVGVQLSWFWGSEEGGERAAGLVGGEEVAQVGEEGAVL